MTDPTTAPAEIIVLHVPTGLGAGIHAGFFILFCEILMTIKGLGF